MHGNCDSRDHRFGQIPEGQTAQEVEQSLQITASTQNGSSQLIQGETTATMVSYFGAFNTAGNYTVSFSYGGQTSSFSNIVVSQVASGCSVNSVSLNAAIQGNQVTLLP